MQLLHIFWLHDFVLKFLSHNVACWMDGGILSVARFQAFLFILSQCIKISAPHESLLPFRVAQVGFKMWRRLILCGLQRFPHFSQRLQASTFKFFWTPPSFHFSVFLDTSKLPLLSFSQHLQASTFQLFSTPLQLSSHFYAAWIFRSSSPPSRLFLLAARQTWETLENFARLEKSWKISTGNVIFFSPGFFWGSRLAKHDEKWDRK